MIISEECIFFIVSLPILLQELQLPNSQSFNKFAERDSMRVCIHRGSKQIGGSCVEVESLGQRLLIDLGLPLDAETNSIQYLPDHVRLDGSDPSLLGILISHPHLDHFGLLAHISPKIPIGMGPAARRILTAAAPFLPGNWPIPAKGWDYQSGQSFEVGSFRITPILVDHAAYDAYALLVESGGKRLFYSGDLRTHGRKGILVERLIANPPKDIDVLLLEGSSLGRLNDNQHFPTETDIETQLVQAFSTTEGLALVHTSAQNIDRVVSIMRACKRTGRRLVIDLYTAAILEATGNLNIPQSNWPDVALFIPQTQRVQIKQNTWFELLKHHSTNRIFIETLQEAPSKSVLLFRPLYCRDLERGDCLKGAAYIYSQWEGYWEKNQYQNLKYWLDRNAIPKISIHTSGHASPGALKRIVKAINPKTVVPIHTFLPERYSELFLNVHFHSDGEWWEV
jgi:ribonuclease J